MAGKSYVFLPNKIFYTRQWMDKTTGKKIADTIFELSNILNELCLTDFEKVILLLLIVTRSGKKLIFTLKRTSFT